MATAIIVYTIRGWRLSSPSSTHCRYSQTSKPGFHFLAAPGLWRVSRSLTLPSLLCLCFLGKTHVAQDNYVPVAATPVEGILARWRWRHANSHNFWRRRVVFVSKSCHRTVVFLRIYTKIPQSLQYTAHIHAAIGDGGPRWQPLNFAVAVTQHLLV